MATSTLGSGTLVLAGTTSGNTTVTATAVAGTTTLTLPAATDTLVGRATTDTLTNKTLTGAAMNGTVGATTPSTGAFTTLSATGNVTLGDASTDTLNVGNGDLIKDASGNLGLGVTPSAWDSTYKAIQVGARSMFFGIGSEANMANNAYYNSGYKYVATSAAGVYTIDANVHKWFNAASGTAGNAITFTQAMTLDANGRFVVGDTSASTSHLLKAANTTTNGLLFSGTNSVLNDGTLSVTVANGSILMVSDNNVGTGAVFFCGYASATITLIADPSSAFATSITAGRICVTKSANSSTVTITNKSGSTKGITFSKVSTSD
jgi:hypothetical protein